MPTMEILHTRELDADMDQLRLICFPPVNGIDSTRDEFDARSWFPTVRIDTKVAAYGRLTLGPNAVFETWSRGTAKIPTGKEVADLGRCMVDPEFRGIDLITFVCLDSMLLAAKLGCRQVVGAVIPNRRLVDRLHAIGFRDSGEPVQQFAPNRSPVTIQPLVAECALVPDWFAHRTRMIAEYRQQGYDVVDGGASQI
jgi:hypothetical protein